MIRKTIRTRPAAAPVAKVEEKVRFVCPCGAALRVPVSRIGSRGRCPMCTERILLTGTKDRQGRWNLEAIYLGNVESSGQTFIIEAPKRPATKAPAPRPAAPARPSAAPGRTASPARPATKAPAGKGYRIEDHFREITAPPQDKVSFRCPCGRKLVARPSMADKRGKCPWCNARLLLVGKVNPKTRLLEIHPLAIDTASTGDTMVIG
jgi:DNA-directed RNA polymerase subunit RPC12/RpoP